MEKANATPGATPMHPLVYYVTRADKPGEIKIGTTTNIGARLGQLQEGGEITLVAVELGGRDVERLRHGQFAPMRTDGEWFIYGAPIICHVMDLDQESVTITGTRSPWYATTTYATTSDAA